MLVQKSQAAQAGWSGVKLGLDCELTNFEELPKLELQSINSCTFELKECYTLRY